MKMVAMEGSLEQGAETAVRQCVRVKPCEKVVIITDVETRKIGDVLKTKAAAISGVHIDYFVMEDFGLRPADGITPLQFPAEIGIALKEANASFYAATGKKGELQSFRKPMLEVVDSNKSLRHAHMIGITEDIMRLGMCADYDKIEKLSARLADILNSAKKITVYTTAGTQIVAEFSPDYHWKVSDGIIRPGKWSNLPDGEVFTCPKHVNGTIVVDGVLGDYFGSKFGLLGKDHVTYTVQDGRVDVDKVQCENVALRRELQDYLKTDENANRIGEFAIGTNTRITELIGNLLQDEKMIGFHFATGYPYPEKTGADWSSKVHLDGVVIKPTIIVDGKTIMYDGIFTHLAQVLF